MWARLDRSSVGPMCSFSRAAKEANPNSPSDRPGSAWKVDSFSKFNCQMGYASVDGGWNATLMVRNLTDARANTFTGTGTFNYAQYWGHTGFGPINTLARPRTISFKLTKNF